MCKCVTYIIGEPTIDTKAAAGSHQLKSTWNKIEQSWVNC